MKTSWRTLGALALAVVVAAPSFGQNGRVGWITLDRPLREKPDPFAWLVGEDPDGSFLKTLEKFDHAADRDDIVSVVVDLKDLQVSMAQLASLRDAIDEVQRAGKPVSVFAEIYGTPELLLASTADEVIIQPGGVASFPGLYAEEIYLADTLKLVGLEAQMVQVGDYKGAAEQFGRSSPSPEWSENIDQLMDDLWTWMSEMLRDGRGYSSEEFDEVLAKAWALDARQAIELGLVDVAIDAYELDEYLSQRFNGAEITEKLGPTPSAMDIDFGNFFAVFNMFSREPDHTPKRDTIAVVHIDGPIIDGESVPASPFGGGEMVGSATVRRALKEIEENDLIKGLVVRINSPGGSAIASEIIWRGVRSVAEHKPVFVSVGSMAASGGYYIAVSGDRIYVNEPSIVGSIGVVGGKIVMGGLYEKLDIGVTPRARGPRAELASSIRPWTASEVQEVRALMSEIYDLFASRVIENRGDRVDMSKIAEGRLFTGRQAIENGMADGLADFETVVELLASEAGLADGSYDTMSYPGPKSFEEMLEEMMPFGVQAPALMSGGLTTAIGAEALRAVFGDAAWGSIGDALAGLAELRDEPVVLVAPRTIVFR
ncbi:MAG: S49 family peptidase [Phycisphaerales bacterium]